MYQEALLGILVKLCDDIFDKTHKVSTVTEEAVKALTVAMYTLVSLKDFYVVFGVFLLLLANPKSDTPFWRALIPVSFALMLMANEQLVHEDIFMFILYLLIIGYAFKLEDTKYPEEESSNKMTCRVIVAVLLLLTLVFNLPQYIFSPRVAQSFNSYFVIGLFYLITSVVTMGLKMKEADTIR